MDERNKITLRTHIRPIAHRDIVRAVEDSLRSYGPDLTGLPKPIADFFAPRANWFWQIRAAAREIPNAEAPAVDLGALARWDGDLQTLVDLHMIGQLRTTVRDKFSDAVLGRNFECWQPTGILGGVHNGSD